MNKDFHDFYKNIKSINFDFNNDLNKFYNRKITKNNFFKKYGHLRPNTYSMYLQIILGIRNINEI